VILKEADSRETSAHGYQNTLHRIPKDYSDTSANEDNSFWNHIR